MKLLLLCVLMLSPPSCGLELVGLDYDGMLDWKEMEKIMNLVKEGMFVDLQ